MARRQALQPLAHLTTPDFIADLTHYAYQAMRRLDDQAGGDFLLSIRDLAEQHPRRDERMTVEQFYDIVTWWTKKAAEGMDPTSFAHLAASLGNPRHMQAAAILATSDVGFANAVYDHVMVRIGGVAADPKNSVRRGSPQREYPDTLTTTIQQIREWSRADTEPPRPPRLVSIDTGSTGR